MRGLSTILWVVLVALVGGVMARYALRFACVLALISAPLGYYVGMLCNERRWGMLQVAWLYGAALVGAAALATVGAFVQLQAYTTPVGFVAGIFAVVMFLEGPARPAEHEPGHCSNCDYDLTGLTSNRCPECGTPFRRRDPFDFRQAR